MKLVNSIESESCHCFYKGINTFGALDFMGIIRVEMNRDEFIQFITDTAELDNDMVKRSLDDSSGDYSGCYIVYKGLCFQHHRSYL